MTEHIPSDADEMGAVPEDEAPTAAELADLEVEGDDVAGAGTRTSKTTSSR